MQTGIILLRSRSTYTMRHGFGHYLLSILEGECHSLFTDQSTARQRPFAAGAVDFVAQKENFLAHTHLPHTVQAAMLDSVVVVAVVFVAASTAAAVVVLVGT
jgi:hypothetical protein